jgi:hypothetical protein
MSTNSRFCRSLRCTNSVSRKELGITGGHAPRQIQVELDAELGGFCVREKSRRVLDTASTTIGSQWLCLCVVLSLRNWRGAIPRRKRQRQSRTLPGIQIASILSISCSLCVTSTRIPATHHIILAAPDGSEHSETEIRLVSLDKRTNEYRNPGASRRLSFVVDGISGRN